MKRRASNLRRATLLGLAGTLALAPAARAAPGGAGEGVAKGKWEQVMTIREPAIPTPPPPHTPEQIGLQAQLAVAAEVGNEYLRRSAKNNNYDKGTGALLLLSGFYGAAVTAFNPAPKNLKAAILATGTFTGLNTGLKFRDRSRAFRAGHRAMACVVETGAPLLNYQPATWTRLGNLRKQAADALATADLALLTAAQTRAALPAPGATLDSQVPALIARLDAQAGDAESKALEERMKVLAGLDRVLAEEQGAFEGAADRTAQVRRQIQDFVDKTLDAAAPDYAAAAKAMGETAEPKAGPGGDASAGGGAPGAALKFKAPGGGAPPTIAQALAEVNIAIRKLEADSPTAATKAHKNLGECIPKAG
jgi:hypothetical protein